MFNKRLTILIPVLLLATLSVSCSKINYDEVIVTIDGEPAITVGDFVRRFERSIDTSTDSDRPVVETYEDAQSFLDDLITGEVLRIEAEKKGYADDEGFKNSLYNYKREQLKEKLFDEIRDEITIKEKQILDYYEKSAEVRSVRLIASSDKSVIGSARDALEGGTPFAEAASQFNDNPALRVSGGELGRPIAYDGRFFSETIFSLEEEGDFSEIVTDPISGEYLIIQLNQIDAISEEERPAYEDVSDEIRTDLIAVELEARTIGVVERRREAANIEYDKDVYDAVLNSPQKELRAKYLRKESIVCTADGEPVSFDSWFEGTNLQFQMSDEMLDEFKKQKPDEYKAMMDSRLDVFIDNALLLAEAKERGIENNEDYLLAVDNFYTGGLIDKFYNDVFIGTLEQPTNDEVLDYFDEHKSEFLVAERMKGYYFWIQDKEEVKSYYFRIRSGEGLSGVGVDAGRQISLRLAATGEATAINANEGSGMFEVTRDPKYSSSPSGEGESKSKKVLRKRVFDGELNQLSPIIEIDEGGYLFYVNMEYVPFKQLEIEDSGVADEAFTRLWSETLQSQETDDKCQSWFSELKEGYEIEIDEKSLSKAFKEILKLEK